MVMRFSPAEPGPGDAPAGVPVHAPVPRAGVFHLDPEVVGVDLGAERELAAVT
jgi:hypothetical protein